MKIVVAMSGGVDSSVAAALLAEQGHEVIGLSMQLYDQAGGEASFGSCCSLDDLHDARRVANTIGIPHYILNFEREFDEQVVSNFVREYTAGRTPLPCAHCNSDLKFATLGNKSHLAIGTQQPAGVPLKGRTWGKNSAHMAEITRRLPVRITIHASQLVAVS